MGRVLIFLLSLVLWPILSVTGPRWLSFMNIAVLLFVLFKLLTEDFRKIRSIKKATESTKSTDSDQPVGLFSDDEPG